MSNNKVSEKAVWEGSISPDNDTPSIGSQMQAQPQMMFCYKCNNVIPGNSTFCPYCQIKLFTECPKCGANIHRNILLAVNVERIEKNIYARKEGNKREKRQLSERIDEKD
ncbi:MAG: hypothetical protein UHN41_05200 [Bacteroidales bacterium]|nr:hypothetical protein [Bacteroidales bacterium]